MRTLLKLSVVLIFFVTNAATAQSLKGKTGIGGALGFNYPEETKSFENNYDEDMYYQIHAKYHYSENWASLLELSHEEFDKKVNGSSLNAFQTFVLGVQYRFPFSCTKLYSGIKFAAGATNIKDSQDNKFRFTAKTGLSLGYFLTQSLVAGIAVDYKFIDAYSNGSTEYKTITPMLELTYYFGAGAVHKAVESVAKIVEEDKDSDNDGVLDSKDLCPSTSSGKKVNNLGCEEKEKAQVKVNVLFPSASSTIDSTYEAEIKKIADLMEEHSDAQVVIEGHSDSLGNNKKNEELSQARADAVKELLVKKFGVQADKISAKGFGPKQPIASNKNAAGRAQNRRVMAVFK